MASRKLHKNGRGNPVDSWWIFWQIDGGCSLYVNCSALKVLLQEQYLQKIHQVAPPSNLNRIMTTSQLVVQMIFGVKTVKLAAGETKNIWHMKLSQHWAQHGQCKSQTAMPWQQTSDSVWQERPFLDEGKAENNTWIHLINKVI